MNRFEETYAGILAARPAGRKTYAPVEPAAYRDRLRAALLARLAGCTLGAPVEGWSIKQMEKYAAELKLPFPVGELLDGDTHTRRTALFIRYLQELHAAAPECRPLRR